MQQFQHHRTKLREIDGLGVHRKVGTQVVQVARPHGARPAFEIFAQPDFFKTLDNIATYQRLLLNLLLAPTNLVRRDNFTVRQSNLRPG